MFIDIACNITCEDSDEKIVEILKNCKESGVMPVFVGLDCESSMKCIDLARQYRTVCYAGIHPNHILSNSEINCTEEDLNRKVSLLKQSIKSIDYNDVTVVGIGECGLDYFRSDKKELQKQVFKLHLELPHSLPYFFHCRSAFKDFSYMCNRFGVVHSFDGTIEEANELLKKGLYIGINGCSLKTDENIAVVKQIPLHRILIETDSPYCLIRKSYAAAAYCTPIKAKCNSPVNVKQIAEVLAKIKSMAIEEVEDVIFENTLRVFPRIKEFVQYWQN